MRGSFKPVLTAALPKQKAAQNTGPDFRALHEDSRALRLASKLADLRAANAYQRTCFAHARANRDTHSIQTKKPPQMRCVLNGEFGAVCTRKAICLPCTAFLGSFSHIAWKKHLKHRHSVLFGKLECVVDIDEIACGTGVFLQFFEDFDLSDKDSEQFGCQRWHLDILLCLCNEFPDATISHIHSADTVIHGYQLFF